MRNFRMINLNPGEQPPKSKKARKKQRAKERRKERYDAVNVLAQIDEQPITGSKILVVLEEVDEKDHGDGPGMALRACAGLAWEQGSSLLTSCSGRVRARVRAGESST